MNETDSSRWKKLAKKFNPKGGKIHIPKDDANPPVIQSPNAILSRANGPQAQIFNSNHLSTPVLIAIILGMSGCLAVAIDGLLIAQQAKTEARVALNHAEEGRIANEVNKALLQAHLAKDKD